MILFSDPLEHLLAPTTLPDRLPTRDAGHATRKITQSHPTSHTMITHVAQCSARKNRWKIGAGEHAPDSLSAARGNARKKSILRFSAILLVWRENRPKESGDSFR